MFKVDTCRLVDRVLLIKSVCDSKEINYMSDLSILRRLMYRNKMRINQLEIDSVKLMVDYPNHGGVGIYPFTKSDITERLSDYFDETKDNYYNRVADYLYADTLLYDHLTNLSINICLRIYDTDGIFGKVWSFDCFEYFMLINKELMEDLPQKPNYEFWMKMEKEKRETDPDSPDVKLMVKISEIFSMNLRKGKEV